MKVREIYDSVASTMLERGGFQLGMVTDAMFLSYYVEVMTDFLQQSGMFKTLSILIQKGGIEEYDLPEIIGEVEHVISQGHSLYASDESDQANASRNWRGAVSTPRSWRQDKGAMQKVSLNPTPSADGNEVHVTGGIIGTISMVVPGVDVDITCQGALYGTIGGDDGPVSIICPTPFFGTIASISCSKSNIAVIGMASLFNPSPTLNTIVEWLQPSFALYVGYGILAKIFGSDGETKDDTRHRYCRARYEEGIVLAQTIMGEEMQEEEAA